jgi:hypothetical protein
MSEHAHADHAHHAAEDDDHPGYNALANVSFIASIPVLCIGGGAAVRQADDGVLLTFAVLAAICIGGGLLGIVWSMFAGQKFATAIVAIILSTLAFALTVYAY